MTGLFNSPYRNWRKLSAKQPIAFPRRHSKFTLASLGLRSSERATAWLTATMTSISIPQRILGKTGERVPVLGLGTACGGLGMSDAEAIERYETAIDRGVTYLDTAPGYERAQRQLGHLVPRRRDEIFLVTKSPTADGAEAVRLLEKNLHDLGTDAVDLCYVHSLGNYDADQVIAADGALAGLREAQRRGLTRYVGFTAHQDRQLGARPAGGGGRRHHGDPSTSPTTTPTASTAPCCPWPPNATSAWQP